ncbi:Uncharacterised protein [Vibrio cholerae]|nr:Uncharacterised protein [Vibrio cholerae]
MYRTASPLLHTGQTTSRVCRLAQNDARCLQETF